ncbi:histidine phosphatase family protein [Sphingobium subterraneum]|uniref:phosphoglycerate mutase (2,3-diphosphoglycerate-dependent) n=1 Tax=Sphingobium subterraneum TaxID=627688 RepID=A0A841IYY4_9SPHN|nr:histidine phosphatase family protein [Sphingobium subterraneum]MBB6123342.1 broad specificity phosphatase PhoE [Sphingobium subterraneum]
MTDAHPFSARDETLQPSRAQQWPTTLWIVRHGQSAGNVARDAADAAALDRIDLHGRDVDVPLSPLGEQQARALGHWFAKEQPDARPDVLISSPYARAIETAHLFRASGGAEPDEPICSDERLREKEFGILDGLTTTGIRTHFPEQAAFRDILGKFYHRSPGGESWCDVILRLRSLMDTVSLHYAGRRVMIFGHQVVVLCLRYIIEKLNEKEILEIDRQADVANCSITEYRFDPQAGRSGNLVLVRYNVTAPIEQERAPVTRAPDPVVAARG